jgi:hypothetical protein
VRANTGILAGRKEQSWLKGRTKTEALRLASQRVRRVARYHHSYDWVPFIRLGDERLAGRADQERFQTRNQALLFFRAMEIGAQV